MLKTRLTEKLSLDCPIIQAPMALVSGGELAAAVSAGGGLGMIGGGYGDADWLARAFDDAGNAPVGCGFITWALAKAPHLLDQVLERRARAIFLSFGDPAPFAAKIRDAGAALICQVQCLDHARSAIDAGADVVVAQGSEAGGHGHTRGTMTLVPELADLLAARAPDTLLCAAGGIGDGRGLAAALMLGADGVVVGSRFWASTEALVHENFHNTAIAATGDDTVQTSAMDQARKLDWPGGFRVRVLDNAFTRRWSGREAELSRVADREANRYRQALSAGDPTIAATMVGEVAGLISDIRPAASILDDMVSGAIAALKAGADTAR